jgi:hypothetical protein
VIGFPLRWLASAGRRRAFFFFLTKRSKSQGLELMSGKIVKAFRAAAQAPDEGSGEDALPWVVRYERLWSQL